MTDVSHYGVDEMNATERREFMAWYEENKVEVFDKKRVLEKYCQDDVTV
jgi:predicted metallo-beta-lactamase superfamily hydrolase